MPPLRGPVVGRVRTDRMKREQRSATRFTTRLRSAIRLHTICFISGGCSRSVPHRPRIPIPPAGGRSAGAVRMVYCIGRMAAHDGFGLVNDAPAESRITI